MKIKFGLAVVIFLAVLALSLIPIKIEYESSHKTPEIAQIEALVEKDEPETNLVLNPLLKPVCACESVGNRYGEPRQFNSDGTVIRGVINNQDIGMCQINLTYHGKAAEKMGIDLFTEQGNIRYANWLFEQSGYTPWNWSKPCWGK